MYDVDELDAYQKQLIDHILTDSINPRKHYAPRGACASLIFNTQRELLISGPAGTGKTLAGLTKLDYCARAYPGARALLVRKSRSDLSDTAMVTFEQDVLGVDHPMVLNGPKRPWRRSYLYPNSSEIVLGGMDRPGKMLSSFFDLIYWVQAEEGNLWAYETLLTRLRGQALPFRQMMSDCNPESPLHWLKMRCDAGIATYLDSDHTDNPLLWDLETNDWTEFGLEYIATLDRLTGSRKLRLRFGKWAVPEGAIYSIFSEEQHKCAAFDIPRLWPRIVAIDPVGAFIGALWMAVDPTSGIVNVYREYLHPFGPPTRRHVKNILRLCGYNERGQVVGQAETVFAWVGGGPSERQARTDWQVAGIPLQEPPITAVWSQIDKVIELMQDFRIVIHDSCPQLLSDVGGIRRKMVNGVPTDVIADKEKFHLGDCLRYGVALLCAPQETTEVVSKLINIGGQW